MRKPLGVESNAPSLVHGEVRGHDQSSLPPEGTERGHTDGGKEPGQGRQPMELNPYVKV